jgi:hypothetical protein
VRLDGGWKCLRIVAGFGDIGAQPSASDNSSVKISRYRIYTIGYLNLYLQFI